MEMVSEMVVEFVMLKMVTELVLEVAAKIVLEMAQLEREIHLKHYPYDSYIIS